MRGLSMKRFDGKVQHSIAYKTPFYFAAYTLWLIFALLNTTAIPEVSSFKVYVYVLVPFLLFLHELSDGLRRGWDLRDLIVFFVLVFLNIQTYLYGHNDLLALSMLVFCGRKVSFEDFAKLTVAISCVLTTLIVILCLLGYIPNVINVRSDGSVRYSLGFAYVTYMPYVLLNVLSLRIYLAKGNLAILEMMVWLVVAVGSYMATDARNSCLLLIALLIGCLLMRGSKNMAKKKVQISNHLNFILSLTFIFLAIAFIAASISYNPSSSIHQLLNNITSERLQRSSHAIDYFGLPFIGGTQILLDKQNLIIDDSYMRIIFDHGMVTLLVALAIYTLALKKSIDKGVWYISFILIVLAIHSVFDAQLLSLQQNSLILLSFQIALGYSDCFGEVVFSRDKSTTTKGSI